MNSPIYDAHSEYGYGWSLFANINETADYVVSISQPSGNNRLFLIVCFASTLYSIVCEGVSAHNLVAGGLSFWYFLDGELPATTGNHTFSVHYLAYHSTFSFFNQLSRVNQAMPFGAAANNTNASLNVPCIPGTIIIDAMLIGPGGAYTVGTGQTKIAESDSAYDMGSLSTSRKLAVTPVENMVWYSPTGPVHIAIPIGGRPQVFGPKFQNN